MSALGKLKVWISFKKSGSQVIIRSLDVRVVISGQFQKTTCIQKRKKKTENIDS